jgi:hypothetical protein
MGRIKSPLQDLKIKKALSLSVKGSFLYLYPVSAAEKSPH